MGKLYLARHGDATEDESGLTPRGRDQAARLGQRLKGTRFDAVHHSAKARAAETAALIGATPSHECDFAADRTPYPSDRRRYPERRRDWFDGVPESERDQDAQALDSAVRHFREQEGTHLLVTHNFVIGWFVRHVLDAPDWRWLGLNSANCALTIVEWAPKRPPALVCFNDTGHLEL